jgi:plastocyanin
MGFRTRTAFGAVVVVLALIGASCGGSGGSGNGVTNPVTPTPPGGGSSPDVTITIVGMNGAQSYSPNPGTVRAGQSVAWRNADSVAHTATANGGSFNTGTIAPGATSNPVVMSTTGSVDYHCSIHPSMVGTLTVTQ